MTNIYKTHVIRAQHHLWFRNTIQRYELAFLDGENESEKFTFASKANAKVNHEKLAQLWLHLEKIHLHATSGKLISHPGFCLTLDLATTTLGCQQAQKVVSKKAVSGFKLAKNTVLSVKSTLRGDLMSQFCYKWYFIIAQQDNMNTKRKTIVSQNNIKSMNELFLFHELDRLDYDLFSKVNGFEIVFKEKTPKISF